jgi:hypothetical protein
MINVDTFCSSQLNVMGKVIGCPTKPEIMHKVHEVLKGIIQQDNAMKEIANSLLIKSEEESETYSNQGTDEWIKIVFGKISEGVGKDEATQKIYTFIKKEIATKKIPDLTISSIDAEAIVERCCTDPLDLDCMMLIFKQGV